MELSTLTNLGLSRSQANAYAALMQYGSLTPPELARIIKETRTNAYKILDQLHELGLSRRNDSSQKLVYRAAHPTALEALAKQQRDQALEQEKRIKQALPGLLSFFYAYSEQPGVRFFQGKDGIKEIFTDMLRARQTVYLVRSPSDIQFYDEAFYAKFKAQRAKLGIKTIALTPDVRSANHDPEADSRNLFERTWLPADAYTGSVEWNIYGDKVAIISYGQEAIGLIIESPQIAESLRQLFLLLRAAHR